MSAMPGMPGMPSRPQGLRPVGGQRQAYDVYAHTRAGMMSSKVAGQRALVYVPNLSSGTVSVIDQRSMKVIDTLPVGRQPQHVVPAWDLQTLWVNNNRSGSLTPINPRTGRIAGASVRVPDPYNLYFTPNGRSALVMAEANRQIDFYDPHTWQLQHALHVDSRCRGVNHADFSPDGKYLIATCEFSGQLVKVDLVRKTVIGYLDLNRGFSSAPQDIKIEPAGRLWYVADMNADGVHEIDGASFRELGFLPTGPETHGLYPSRDGHFLYVANRGGTRQQSSPPYAHAGYNGSVSVIDFATRRVVARWAIPGGGTPDMGGVSADGNRLWLSGRRSGVVYVFDTGGNGGATPAKGHLITKIPVGREPHGLAVWPLPGRFSLGHTGILR
jgi:YVTN family beta-propeller protein